MIVKNYIPCVFTLSDLSNWRDDFHCCSMIAADKLVDYFVSKMPFTNHICMSLPSRPVGFLSETGDEILCVRDPILQSTGHGLWEVSSEVWISFRGSRLGCNGLQFSPEKIDHFLDWLKERGLTREA